MKLVGEYDSGMPKELPPSRVAPQFVVRLPDEAFRDRLAAAAKERGRSMNSEIVARLEASFQDGPNEFAEWENYKKEVHHRMRYEASRTQTAAMALAYIDLYHMALEGTVSEDQDGIESMLELAESYLAAIKDGKWERLSAEYDAAKERHDALSKRMDAMPVPIKKARKTTAKKG